MLAPSAAAARARSRRHIRRRSPPACFALGDAGHRDDGRALLVRRDEARAQHLRQHQARRARGPPSGLARGEYFEGAFKQAGDERRFRQRQLARRLAEIAPRRRVDAVGAAAQIDAVEIELEDVRLRQPRLEPDRERQLLELARERAVGREIEVLGELLRQRGAALHEVAGCARWRSPRATGPKGRRRVLVEALVLGGDHRIDDVARQQIERHVVVGAAALGEQRAVARQDADERAAGPWAAATAGRDRRRSTRRASARGRRRRRRPRRSGQSSAAACQTTGALARRRRRRRRWLAGKEPHGGSVLPSDRWRRHGRRRADPTGRG